MVYSELCDFLEVHEIPFETESCLAPYTSFKIGGRCPVLIKPRNFEQAKAALREIKGLECDCCFLGNGSNLLVSDNGYDGVVLLTSGLNSIKVESDGTIVCGAGVSLSKLCSTAYEHSLGGAEFAWGIPGSVGGAVYMNAGAYGGEIKDIISECTFLNEAGEAVSLPAAELALTYRHSLFSERSCLICSASFSLLQTEQAEIKTKMDDYIERRKSKQPLEFPSAGSTFKRPEGSYAAALIDECGLKGFSVGSAQVSEKHAGFIVNRGGATCEDVLRLIEYIRQTVYRQTGYLLECEVKRLGF